MIQCQYNRAKYVLQPVYNVKGFGAKGDGVTDDTQAIRNTIQAALSLGTKVLYFPYGTYLISDTIEIPSGFKLVGAGYEWHQTGKGVTIKRTANVVAFRSQGTSILSGGPHNRNVEFYNIQFHGGDYSADFLQLIACSLVKLVNCQFFGMTGRQILMQEVFDSRVLFCEFDWGGSSDGTLPAVELTGGTGGYEYTNHVHFYGCRFETYRGTALALTGSNTNKIYVTNCKFESVVSTIRPIHIENAAIVILDNVEITQVPTDPTVTTPELVYINNSQVVYARLFVSKFGGGTPGTDLGYVETVVRVLSTFAFDINLQCSYGFHDALSGQYFVTSDGQNTHMYNIDVKTAPTWPSGKRPSNILQRKWKGSLSVEGDGYEPSISLVRSDASPNTPWHIGRIETNNDLRINYGEQTALRLNTDLEAKFYGPVTFLRGLHPAQLTSAPWGREGSIYTDTSNSIPTQRMLLGEAWRRIGWASAAPTTGTWNTGDIIFNTSPTAGEYVGWVCVAGGTPGTWEAFGAIST